MPVQHERRLTHPPDIGKTGCDLFKGGGHDGFSKQSVKAILAFELSPQDAAGHWGCRLFVWESRPRDEGCLNRGRWGWMDGRVRLGVDLLFCLQLPALMGRGLEGDLA